MTEIPLENLVANYFATHRENQISMPLLKSLRDKIETGLPGSYIDITRDSIIQAVQVNPDFIYLTEEGRIEGFGNNLIQLRESNSFLEERYNWRLPEEIKARYLSIIASITTQI